MAQADAGGRRILSSGFRAAYANNHAPVVDLLLTQERYHLLKHAIRVYSDRMVPTYTLASQVFQWACANGYLSVVRKLLQWRGKPYLDVHAQQEAAFRRACANGHTEVVQVLLALAGDRAVNVHAHQEAALRSVHTEKHTEIRDMLLALTGAQTADPAVVKLLGLVQARHNAVWASTGRTCPRIGRRLLVCSRRLRRSRRVRGSAHPVPPSKRAAPCA